VLDKQEYDKFKDALDSESHQLNQMEITELRRYINTGIKPGQFVQAILENNLVDACSYADIRARRRIYEYVCWLCNNAPEECWGSERAVYDWLRK